MSGQVVDTDTGELVETCSAEEARELTDQIQTAMAKTERLKAEAIRRGIRPHGGKRETKPQDVYFIATRYSRMIKIGLARNPQGRLASLQTASPEPLDLLKVLPGVGREGEARLHERLDGSRSHGEWFFPTDEVMAAVTEVT